MEFSNPTTPKHKESVLPMINVVFLLLIFFLMTAQIAPPEPMEVESPVADLSTDPEEAPVLFIAADGAMAFEDVRGDAALVALAARAEAQPVLRLKLDAALPGAVLAKRMQQFAAMGFAKIEIIVEPS